MSDMKTRIVVEYEGKTVAAGAQANAADLKAIGDAAGASAAKASAALQGAAISAKQTAAALRNVPAQMTDIFVGLSSGQSPLMVLLQQGGQLKDMFGGIGPAAKALGGYVLGLVNPFTVAAAAAGGLALAYHQGSKEADEYRNALILTGKAAGISAAEVANAARRVADATGGTRGASAEALAAGIYGGITGAALESVADAAVRMEQVTGRAIGDTVAEFAKLAKDPVAASVKLNEQYNFLTIDIFRSVKAFQESGRGAEAAALAMKTYADAVRERTGEITSNLGLIENKWLGLKAVFKDVSDAALEIGRRSDPVAKAVQDIFDLQLKIRENSKPEVMAYDPRSRQAENAILKEKLVLARAHLATVVAAARAETAAAEKRRDEAAKTKAVIAAETKPPGKSSKAEKYSPGADFLAWQQQMRAGESQLSASEIMRQLHASDAEADALEAKAAAMDALHMKRIEMYRIETEGEEAVREHLEKTTAAIDEMSQFTIEAARNMQDAMADGFFDIMQGKFDKLGSSFKATLDRMVANAIAANLSEAMFGNFGKTGKVGGWAEKLLNLLPGAGGGDSGALDFAGEAAAFIDPFAAGGVLRSAGLHPYANTIVSSPTLFKFAQGGAFSRGLMGESGPEAIMPLTRGPDGRLGVQASGGANITVIVQGATNAPDVRRAAGQGAREALTAFSGAQRYG